MWHFIACCLNSYGTNTSLMRLQERQKQLESLGISLQSSGIKVGDDKCFLVNLNADPALNELLVYYLKVRSQACLLSSAMRQSSISQYPLYSENHVYSKRMSQQIVFVCFSCSVEESWVSKTSLSFSSLSDVNIFFNLVNMKKWYSDIISNKLSSLTSILQCD